MAIDEELAARFRATLTGLEGMSERKMMGGMCFMLNGHMIGGAHREKDGSGWFMFRVGKDNEAAAEALGTGEVMQQGGRRMTGLYFVPAEPCPDAVFDAWRALAVGHALSLPPK